MLQSMRRWGVGFGGNLCLCVLVSTCVCVIVRVCMLASARAAIEISWRGRSEKSCMEEKLGSL